MKKPKLYILGDSFAANLFEDPWLNEGTAIDLFKKDFESNNIAKLKWWTDYLGEWGGYEVINLGFGGCCNEDIIYQFSEIGEYNPGDRIIVHWTNPMRFNLYQNKHVRSVNPDYLEHIKIGDAWMEHILEIFETRSFLWNAEDGERVRKFMRYLWEKHKEFKPIYFSVFAENLFYMKNDPGFFEINLFLRPECYITTESNNKYLDGHWGYVGNIRAALLFLAKLSYDDVHPNDLLTLMRYEHTAKKFIELNLYKQVIKRNQKKLI